MKKIISSLILIVALTLTSVGQNNHYAKVGQDSLYGILHINILMQGGTLSVPAANKEVIFFNGQEEVAKCYTNQNGICVFLIKTKLKDFVLLQVGRENPVVHTLEEKVVFYDKNIWNLKIKPQEGEIEDIPEEKVAEIVLTDKYDLTEKSGPIIFSITINLD